jgi:hypothetical protein
MSENKNEGNAYTYKPPTSLLLLEATVAGVWQRVRAYGPLRREYASLETYTNICICVCVLENLRFEGCVNVKMELDNTC